MLTRIQRLHSALQIEVTLPDRSDTSIVHAVIEEKAFKSPLPLAKPVNDYDGSIKLSKWDHAGIFIER